MRFFLLSRHSVSRDSRGNGVLRRLISFLLLIIIPVYAWGHVVHVGNVSIPVHSEKYTTPSINFKTANNELYHIPMTTQSLTGTIHVLRDDVIYSACIGEKTHVGHYWFIGSCLVGADDDVYIEADGAYIDTGVIADKQHIIQSEYDMALLNFNDGWTGANLFTQVRAASERSALTVYNSDDIVAWIPINLFQKYHIISNFTLNGDCLTENLIVDNDSITREWGAINDYAFGVWVPKLGGLEVLPGLNAKLYKYRVYVNGVLARDMVPVPSGMQIGNYTVPSNGMWDIVEQKFYGTATIYDFSYGID